MKVGKDFGAKEYEYVITSFMVCTLYYQLCTGQVMSFWGLGLLSQVSWPVFRLEYCLEPWVYLIVLHVYLLSVVGFCLDCKQSLFSSKICGEECKTNKGASVMCKRPCQEQLVVQGSEEWFPTRIWMLLWQVTSMTLPPCFENDSPDFLRKSIEAVFEEKRDCLLSRFLSCYEILIILKRVKFQNTFCWNHSHHQFLMEMNH